MAAALAMAAAAAAWRCAWRRPGPAGSRFAAVAPRGGPDSAPRRRLSGAGRVVVEVDEDAGVAVLRMKRPPVNSLSLPFLAELAAALQQLEEKRACRGLVLTSAAPTVFSAGLDVTEMCGKSAEHYARFWTAVQELWLRLYGSRLVTVAAVNGSSPAGGCLMALACDYRLMAENPKYSIGLNETRLGIVAPFWFKDTMLNTIGHRATERSLQLGLLYSPQEALRVGIVDKLVPEEKIQAAAAEVMTQWLAIPDQARQLSKLSLRKPAIDRLLAQRESDVEEFVRFISRDAVQKSLQMYMEMLKQRKA